ncbi:PTS sugar transporter subunit IIC [Lapidilactobacillus mulanensis]|uniref:Permease IIC component n=1 Tax=Lapidilactobacillus mulanensis TaxID=2485999 RepID=A0ABW4DP51_9LACO|nr:PTS transporter subunit EIIC [Lapidilactobacillus mulanensis]
MKIFSVDRALKFAGKIQQNTYIKGISSGLAALMPLIIAGAMFTIIDALGIPVYQEFLVNVGIKPYLRYPNLVTNGLLSIYASFSISYVLAKEHKIDGFSTGIISVMAFVLLFPLTTTAKGIDMIPLHYLGAEGMFTAIIVAILVERIVFFLNKHQLIIKMPDGVPDMIVKSFAALIPAFVVIFVFMTIKIIFGATGMETFPNFVTQIIQAPIRKLGGSWIALVVIMLIVNLLWFFGIHGHLVALSVMTPVYMQMDLENLGAYQANTPLPNIIGGAFIGIYASGATVLFGLVFWMLRARAKRYKTLGKLALVPMLLGIGEPLAFGVPYVMNFVLFIPVVFCGAINSLLAYIATAMNILPRLNGVSAPLPIVGNGFMAGGWRVAAFQIFLCVLNVLIWMPFFKKLDSMEMEGKL